MTAWARLSRWCGDYAYQGVLAGLRRSCWLRHLRLSATAAERGWISIATCGRFCRRTALRATDLTKRRGRPSCGSMWPSRRYADRDGVTPIVPGDLAKSEVWRRITSEDEAEMMPPPDSHTALTAAAEGDAQAVDRGGGGLRQALVVHSAGEGGSCRRFRTKPGRGTRSIGSCLARLDAEGLKPSPEADRRTLIRRLSLDLTGLPPSAEEVEAFVADESTGRVRAARRSAAGEPALRRADGARLARLRPGTPTRTAIRSTAAGTCGCGAIG